MKQRITETDMRRLVDRINRETGSPATAYPESGPTEGNAHVGHYYFSRAYGGWSLVRITCPAGGVRTVIGHGHEPARIAREKAMAWLDGFNAGKHAGEARP